MEGEISPAERYAYLRQMTLALLSLATGSTWTTLGDGLNSAKEALENPNAFLEKKTKWQDRFRWWMRSWTAELAEAASESGDDALFSDYFGIKYNYAVEQLRDIGTSAPLTAEDVAHAHRLNLLPERETAAILLHFGADRTFFRAITDRKASAKLVERCPAFGELRDRVVNRILEMETMRGELPTPLSGTAENIAHYAGARHFVAILEKCGRDPFDRSVLGGLYGTVTRKQMLSHLLHVCHPASGENAETLRALLQGRKISEQTLVDGAMFAPQWIGIVGEVLRWDGFASACWYFHAHVNAAFSAEKETMVARFSDIAPQELVDGAFDIDWHREAYSALGEKRFDMVYRAAKYISSGSNHRRAQLFSDAINGKLKLATVEKDITAKRNQNMVLCYGLMPLAKNRDADMLHRYEVLQAFLKESRKFGSQRRESEGRAAALALENLARNAGFGDAGRFVWNMECAKFDSIRPYLDKEHPIRADDVSLWLEVNELGETDLVVERNGKRLKDVPAALKKHPAVADIKQVRKALGDQRSRARVFMERCMERGNAFPLHELAALSNHPVIGPMLKTLVLRCGERLEYLDGLLADGATGEACIAHPVHLFRSGRWHEFQRELFDRSVRQPFKQVFRELYLPTADELEAGTGSERYAGYQVRPKQGLALLKTRGWTVNYDSGLQKVYRKENIIAEVYAAADWFSPADVENPTLEGVTFERRDNGKPIPLREVPEVIFSEVMRDLDLMVSVAHAGGVDPETSQSTMEMRQVIAAEAVRLFRLDNVRLEGPHAFVKGKRGEYTVHLGSGMVHQKAGGAIVVLAVPAQHRGRIFLPFVDEDPRTAEVISKILLFAEDGAIKDPSILEQIGQQA